MENHNYSQLDLDCPPILPENWDGADLESSFAEDGGNDFGAEFPVGAEEESDQAAPVSAEDDFTSESDAAEEDTSASPTSEAASDLPETAEQEAMPNPPAMDAQDEPPEPVRTFTPPAGRDLRGELEQLRALYPNLRSMPKEVSRAVTRGVPVLSAYLAYRDQEREKSNALTRRENQILRNNAYAAAHAPVHGISGGASAAVSSKSDFEKGFDDGFAWR